MRKIFALLMIGATLTLAASTGMAFGPTVHGSVTQKFSGGTGDGTYVIAVDGAPHDVPLNVYLAVQVGDTVNFDGPHWTIAGREIE